MNHLEHWKYMAMRNIYGRSRLSCILKAARLCMLWLYYRRTDESVVVTCWKCEDEHKVYKRSLYYYDNMKCGRCYL